MAGSVNKVILVGNLGRDPEIRSTQDGTRIANLSLATSESWRDKNSGERKERTEWHRVVIFNENLVKVAEQYLKKGSKIYVEGALQTRKWTDQAGIARRAAGGVTKRQEDAAAIEVNPIERELAAERGGEAAGAREGQQRDGAVGAGGHRLGTRIGRRRELDKEALPRVIGEIGQTAERRALVRGERRLRVLAEEHVARLAPAAPRRLGGRRRANPDIELGDLAPPAPEVDEAREGG